MAKSQQSFKKNELEKQKQKKRDEKALRKENRKANNSGGLDSMIAYVDEYGNITDTPPDPNRKKIEVNPDTISVSVSRRTEEDEVEQERTGVVTFFNHEKGYGFIKDLQSQQSIFVHINDVQGDITEKSKVSFLNGMGAKGPVALSVKVTS
jgi:cold shock CspA family protein